jgi:LysM repeat protein
MLDNESPQDVIEAYRKRQQKMPFIVGGIAVLLVAVGIIVMILFLSGNGGPSITLFATKTPTPTVTYTPTPVTPTITPSMTPTVTETPTATLTSTPSGPFEYTVQENDNCFDIAATFEVDLEILLALNNFGGTCPIVPGQAILIPGPNTELPTATPLPTGLARGTKIDYTVRANDTLEIIAAAFNSTIEAILDANDLTEDDINTIFIGQTLIVPVNLVTPVPSATARITDAVNTGTTATAAP